MTARAAGSGSARAATFVQTSSPAAGYDFGSDGELGAWTGSCPAAVGGTAAHASTARKAGMAASWRRRVTRSSFLALETPVASRGRLGAAAAAANEEEREQQNDCDNCQDCVEHVLPFCRRVCLLSLAHERGTRNPPTVLRLLLRRASSRQPIPRPSRRALMGPDRRLFLFQTSSC